jgi:hypothetical protein
MELYDKLTQLKKDLSEKLSTANGYNTDLADVVHGELLPSEVIQTPIVCFITEGDNPDPDFMDNTQRALANVIIYGYVQSTDDHKPLFDLVEDLIKFIDDKDDWTYTDDTLYGERTYRYGNKLNLDKDMFFIMIQLQYNI